jgi:hypothetical protein
LDQAIETEKVLVLQSTDNQAQAQEELDKVLDQVVINEVWALEANREARAQEEEKEEHWVLEEMKEG